MPRSRVASAIALSTLLFVGCFAIFASVAGATAMTWNNPAGGAWSDPANWTPNNVPDAAGEGAILPTLSGPYQVTLDFDPEIDGMQIASGATLTVLGDGSTLGRLVVMGGITNYGVLEGDGKLRFRSDGILYNYGTIRVSHGALINVNRPLVKNLGGTITSGPGGGSFTIMMPYDVGGTLDCNEGGLLVADGGDLHVSAGTIWNSEVRRVGSIGSVAVGIATFQNVIVASGAELSVPGHADFMAAMDDVLMNNGTVRVSGSISFGIIDGQYSIPIDGTGTLILEGGSLGLGNGATLWNKSGHTIQGCGTINPPFLNDGTVNLDCGGQLGIFPGSFVNRKVMRVRGKQFVIKGDGIVLTNKGTLSAIGGKISVEQGATINNTGGVISAAGSNVYLGSATTEGTVIGGTLESVGTSLFQVQKSATLRDVTLGSTGMLQTLAGATTNAIGTRFLNSGTNRVAPFGKFVVGSTTDYVQTSGVTSIEGGTLSSARDLQIQSGVLRGRGTVLANVVNSGYVIPDIGTGPLRIQGNYRQTSAGTFQPSIVGGDRSSQLDVTGSATLDGMLSTSVAAGYVPAAGSSFSVFSYGSVSGQFAQMGSGLSAVSQLGITPVYGEGALELLVSSPVSVGGSSMPATLRFYGTRSARGSSFVLELPSAADVKGRVYDAAGREVARLADGRQEAGVHVFALRNASGAGLPSGIYFARVEMSRSGASDVRSARVAVLN